MARDNHRRIDTLTVATGADDLTGHAGLLPIVTFNEGHAARPHPDGDVGARRASATLPGLAAFTVTHPSARPLLVGGDGVPLADFLSKPVEHWLAV